MEYFGWTFAEVKKLDLLQINWLVRMINKAEKEKARAGRIKLPKRRR